MTAVDPTTGEVLDKEDAHMANVRAIKAAFEGLNTNKWAAGDVALAEVPMGDDHSHNGGLVAVRRLAEEAGVDFDALRNYRNVSAAWPHATRVASASWSVHRELMGLDERARLLKKHPTMTVNEARKLVGKQPANYRKPSTRSADPEEWTDEDWQTFDKEVVTATKTLLTALNTWQRGIYSPSVEALAQLSLVKPADLDSELAQLLGQA